jgi:hypothetical protein
MSDISTAIERPLAPSPFLPGTQIQFADIERKAKELLSKATKVGDCWLCHLAPSTKGYCNVSFGRAVKIQAGRVVLFAIEPDMPHELLALHTCDNRRCIRPDHLFSGTAQNNTDDMIAKGRDKLVQPRTDHRYRDDILKLQAEGLNRFEIAEKLFISPNTVWNYISPRGPYYVGQ